MDFVLNIDNRLFHLVNRDMTAGFLDLMMPFVTEKFNFLGVIIVAAALIVVLGNKKDRIGLGVLVVLVLSSDLACALLKDAITRIRPCNAMEVRLLAGCGDSFSFPSGHATNIFAAMVFLSLRYKKFFPLFLSIAFAVAYSRVYVGVHYPLDVTAGAVLGSFMAFIFTGGERRALEAFETKRRGRYSEGQ